MTTLWKWRLFLIAREADNTAENRTALAEIFTNNTSGETVVNERKMFNSVIRFSTTGNLPVQAFGLSTLVKSEMRVALLDFFDNLSLSRWYAVASRDLANFNTGELVAANGGSGVIGELYTWQDVLNDLFTERGLQVITQ